MSTLYKVAAVVCLCVGCGPSAQERYNAEVKVLENLESELHEMRGGLFRTDESVVSEAEVRLGSEVEAQRKRVSEAKAKLGL